MRTPDPTGRLASSCARSRVGGADVGAHLRGNRPRWRTGPSPYVPAVAEWPARLIVGGMGARALNAALGFWLFLSAELWPHDWHQRANAWIVGAFIVMLALTALSGAAWARGGNLILAGWLMVSTLLWPRVSVLTFWNQMLVALLVALVAAVPRLRLLRRGHDPQRSQPPPGLAGH
jgi:hypothetical protein